MHAFLDLLDLACGKRVAEGDEISARRLQLSVAALLSSLVFAVIWGVAVGSRVPAFAIANAYKLPMIILLSTVFAVPAGLLTWKLSGAQCRATDLLLGFSSGVFSSTLVLAVLAPVVALYYHSSSWAGPVLAQGGIALAMCVGALVFARGVLGRVEGRRGSVLLAMGAFLLMQVATVLQLIALAAPILPERTAFDHGIDRLSPREGR